MGLSNFCIVQREKEQRALRSFIAYGLIGSSLFHLALGIGIQALWQRKPAIAEDDAIEVIIVDTPEPKIEEPEIEKPIEQQITKNSEPQPQAETAASSELAYTQPSSSVTPSPIPTIQPDSPAQPVQQAPQQPAPIPERIEIETAPSPQPTTQAPEPAQPQPNATQPAPAPPKPTVIPQPLRRIGSRMRDVLTGKANTESPEVSVSESSSKSPGSVAANRNSTPSPTGVSQPLQSSAQGSRGFRNSMSRSDSSANPGNSRSPASPTSPGSVAANRGTLSRQPTRPSGAIQSSSNNTRPFQDGINRSTSSPGNSRSPASSSSPGNVAANQAPPKQSAPSRSGGGLSCISNCQPQYPRSLSNQSVQGRPIVRLTIGADGRVQSVQLAKSSGNSQLDRAALQGASKMRFAPLGATTTGRVAINFAVRGTDFHREARERQAQLERERQAQLERERQAQQEQERQAQLERERQAQLEQERQAQQERERQAQQERERQAQQEGERQAQQEQERQAQQESERQAQQEQERQAQQERERQAQQEQERQAQQERERQAQQEQERQAQQERERQAQQERERQVQQERERQAQQELSQ